MKKRILPLILLTSLLLCAVLLPASAAMLSSGVSVLASDATLLKSGYIGKTVSFTQTDFKQALGAPKIDTVTITALPKEEEGQLKLASSLVAKGQTISGAVLDLLKFVPANNTVTEAHFAFTAGNLAGGAEIPCTIRLLEKKNEAPTLAPVQASAVETQKGISVFGTLSAHDPEGDKLHFRVVSYPKHGTLCLTDASTGEYRYTPAAGYTGRDSFTYVVRDEYGNYSGVGTLSLTVKGRNSTLVYADMKENRSELAAIVLTDSGIVLGRLSGDNLYFDPEETVSRGDFVVMAMKAAGISPAEGLIETCFDDNDKIPVSIRPYIATAQSLGFVNGTFNGTGLYFESERPVLRSEAAVILCNILGCEKSLDKQVFAAGETVPVWAADSVCTLYHLGALQKQSTGGLGANEKLTRGDAATMLYTVMKK